MKPIRTMFLCAGAAGAVLALAVPSRAEAKINPYASIIDRNPFGLKDPPPPPKDQPAAPVTPLAKVVLTGITSLLGPTSKKCFLEITEQEAGKQNVVTRPILMEGERSGSVEVVSIDLEKNLVHIRNGGQEVDLKFEDPSKSVASAAPRPVVPGMVNPAVPFTPHPGIPQPPHTAAAPAPTIISPGSTDNASHGSVMVYGNQASTTAATIPNAPVVPNHPQFNGAIPPALGTSETGARIIPSRPVRSYPTPPPFPGATR